MDPEYEITWAEGVDHDDEHGHQIICESRSDDLIEENNDIEEDEEYLVGEEIIPSTEIITISNSLDQIAAENLIYMAQDGSVANMGDLIEEQVDQVDNADYNEQQYFEHVTEEVITDDWVQQQGEDRVEVPVYQLVGNEQSEEVLVPLPTDEYTTSRPYPCDFCSRRFRKKANLMNHMVAHKNVKPHICNLCGARYIRKMELMNHLKVHAQVPDPNMEYILDHNDGKSADEQDGDDESLLTVMHTGGPSKQRRRVAQVNTSVPRKLVSRTVESGKKMPIQKKRYNESADTSNNYYKEPESILPDHMPASNPSRPFVCQVCGVSFTREKALNAHVLLHGVDNAIECDTCNEVFWSAESLQEHQKIHEVDDESSGSEYEPDGDKTASDDDFDPKYGNYYCNICGMSFHRSELLKRHTKTHKNDFDSNRNDSASENHCCNVCGNTFAEALDLLAHAEIHTRASIQKCTLCGESFAHDNEIRQHIATAHEKDLTATTCRMCGKHCKDERTLMKHAWDHSKEKNHSCMKCGKTFYNKARLKRHMQSHRNKSVSCNVCGESFPDGRTLMNHRHSHTNLSGRQFPCRECGKTFGSRSSQQIHMRIHTGERPYGCRFCWKAFADGGTLRKHERIHTGEKPYACPVCPRAFNQRVVLREHIRSHHSQPDPNYEDSLMPYYCTVCGHLFKTSQEIIQHLIEHSDANTVSNRQPVVGPRKYKRRRKLKPEELETFRKSKNDTITVKPTSKRTSRKRDVSEQSDTYYSSSYEHQEDVNYESGRNDNEMDNIEVDEPIVQRIHSVGTRVKHESVAEASDPLYTTDYLETTPRRKSPTKRQSTVQSLDVASPSSSYSPSAQRQPRLIHTSKKKVVVETKGGRTATKMRTIITTNEIKSVDNGGTRRSSRAKPQTTKKIETIQSPSPSSRSLTNGTPRSTKSQAVTSTNSKFQNNLFAELSKKSSNFSPDVVSDLEEILGSPIKTTRDSHVSDQASRTQAKSDQLNSKGNSGMVRVDYRSHTDDESKPATRSSKRLSNRVQPMPNIEPITKTTKANTKMKKSSVSSSSTVAFNTGLSSEESQESQDEQYDDNLQMSNNTPDNIVMNIKQEKEVSYTMTDDNSVFTCEMCSAIFSDRAQLLVHVPVHI